MGLRRLSIFTAICGRLAVASRHNSLTTKLERLEESCEKLRNRELIRERSEFDRFFFKRYSCSFRVMILEVDAIVVRRVNKIRISGMRFL